MSASVCCGATRAYIGYVRTVLPFPWGRIGATSIPVAWRTIFVHQSRKYEEEGRRGEVSRCSRYLFLSDAADKGACSGSPVVSCTPSAGKRHACGTPTSKILRHQRRRDDQLERPRRHPCAGDLSSPPSPSLLSKKPRGSFMPPLSLSCRCRPARVMPTHANSGRLVLLRSSLLKPSEPLWPQ